MPFSIWEYLRERTRDAVLAGFQDALDVAEQGDINGSQHEAANRLRARLAGHHLDTEPKSLPSASMNGSAVSASPPVAEAPTRPVEASAFDADLESRLNAAASQNATQAPPTATRPPGRGRRGRPPKNGANGSR